ncbi:MAG: thioredoxin family protein [Chloroflexi bacterium]|nr:thioredoxin family protein [Chloroflexota bacterium]
MASPRVRADVVEAQEFMDLAQHYRVRGVPKIVINEVHWFEGAAPEATFIQRLLEAVTPPTAEAE